MKRYGLHNMQGGLIGEFDTAQQAADAAKPGQFAFDRHARIATGYPVTAFYAESTGPVALLGAQFRYRSDALDFLRSKGF